MGFYLNKKHLYRKNEDCIFHCLRRFFFVSQTSGLQGKHIKGLCPEKDVHAAATKCLKNKDKCMPQCKKCVFKNCRGLFGRALARCTVTKCARPCLCKKKCLSVCLKM